MYNGTETRPGVVNRLTRGTYGFGIFKSTDGGISWEPTLSWPYDELKGVQQLALNPLNDQSLYAATSDGLYKTTDGGLTWRLLKEQPMAVDVAVDPVDTNRMYVTFGSLFHEASGIYRSSDGGQNFTQLRIGIPTAYSGKALLTIDPSSNKTLYASVADAFQSVGLFRSSNFGDSWVQTSEADVAAFQGWYAHDVAVNPRNPEEVIQVGIDAWRSENFGFVLEQQTSWMKGRTGRLPEDGPDGPPDYVHPDIHQAAYHPLLENVVFLATDGGIYVSEDGGRTYESRNGGLHTTQFYANFSNSAQRPDFAIGGMQDNSSAIYTGEPAWIKILGGDGMSTAIDPEQDNIVYASSQLLNIFRSTNGGRDFVDIAPGALEPAFSAPFEIAPSNPRILYAGGQLLFKSTDRGNTWTTPNPGFIDDGNPIIKLAVSPTNSNHLLASTAPVENSTAKVFRSQNGGQNWERINGLPDRIATDLTCHPTRPEIAFLTMGGFNSFHVYQTMNGGKDWFPIDNQLPDIPHQTIVVDPSRPDFIYIGNDLGVYASEDGGATWQPFMLGLPEAVLAMDLSISPSNQKIRLATHGLGVYEADLIGQLVSTPNNPNAVLPTMEYFPNPAHDDLTILFQLSDVQPLRISVGSVTGQLEKEINLGKLNSGEHRQQIRLDDLPVGLHYFQLINSESSLAVSQAVFFVKF